jgi:sugar O-acyltransferase (sialic acid O-acetyltransferase NeuD family)
MKKSRKKFNILGMASSAVAILFDIVTEIYGEKEFNIWQNIPVEEEVKLPLTTDRYQYHIHSPNEAAGLKKHDTSNIIFGLPGPDAKQTVFEYFLRDADIAESMYKTVVHPTAYVSPSAQVASGVLLEPGTVISAQTDISFGVSIKRGVSIGHHNRIGKYCEINPGVVVSGNVNVGEKVIIGSSASVKDGVSIGDNTIIGMGSNVVKDIPSGVVAYGNPCQVEKER